MLNDIDNNNIVFIITSICCDIKLSLIASDYKWILIVPFSPIQHRPISTFLTSAQLYETPKRHLGRCIDPVAHLMMIYQPLANRGVVL